MAINCRTNIPASINVIDFKISSIGAPILSLDFTEVTMNYIGVANPKNTDVSIVACDFSLDSGTTWNPMTTDSTLTRLTFETSGTSNEFVWKIREDISGSIYNTSIKIRFRAETFFGSDIVDTEYRIRSIYLPKTVIIASPLNPPVFAPDYKGVAGPSLLVNAPKPQQEE